MTNKAITTNNNLLVVAKDRCFFMDMVEKIEWALEQREHLFTQHENELITTKEFVDQMLLFEQVISKWKISKEEFIKMHKCIDK